MRFDKQFFGVFIALSWALIIDSVLAPSPGFYFIPAVSALIVFRYSPLTFSWINTAVAVLLGFSLIFLSGVYLIQVMPSLLFALQAGVFMFSITLILYVFYPKKK